MALFHSRFNVLGVKITATNNDHIFQPTSHIKLALVKKPEIACAQERSFTCVLKVSLKDILCLITSPSVSTGNAWARNPYFAYYTGDALLTSFGIDNHHVLI